ncbi:MAG: hypothetical protein M3Q71_21400 [Chloroflexota bacterium]|nr:hypothetical protein [Chloroflexota bacterium]
MVDPQQSAQAAPLRIEVAVGPHGHRPGWSVLRATFARESEHERRVAQALDALVGPLHDPPESPNPKEDGDGAEA